MKRRAVTLIETLVACFVLVSAFVIFVAMLQGIFDSSTQLQLKAKASIVAANQLARIRDWSRQSTTGHPNFDGLAAHFNGNVNDAEWPLFKVTTTITTPAMFSPCTELEKVHTVSPLIHNMSESYRKLVLDVSWDSYNPARTARFVTLLGSPQRKIRATNPVVVTPEAGLPGTIPSSGCAIRFKAQLMDDLNAPVPDASFHWNVWPITPIPNATGGDGSVVADNNGFTATYNSVYTAPDGSSQSIPNSYCVVRAVVRYHGTEYFGDSPTMFVGP